MGLDPLGFVPIRRGRFHHIRVDRPLRQKFRLAELFCLLFKNADKLLTDDPSLLLRFGDILERAEELLRRVHRDQLRLQMLAKCGRHLLALIFSQQACVHKHRDQLVADGLAHQRRRHGRVHAARDRRQDAFASHLLTNPRDRIFDDRGGRPFGFRSANVNRKMFEQFDSVRRVMHFGMELHAEIFPREITHRREGTVPRFRQRDESLRHFGNPVAV